MTALYTPPNSKTAVRVIVLDPPSDKPRVWVQIKNGQAIKVDQSRLEESK